MEDWLEDPLMKFDKGKGLHIYRQPEKETIDQGAWHSFHFATRLKLEGAVYFYRYLRGAAIYPEDKGLPLLAHRQKRWYADAFFFELCSAYETLLQELNIIYEKGLSSKDVKWGEMKSSMPKTLVKMSEKEWAADWFKRVRWYRNTATHHYVVPMTESLEGFSDQLLNADLDEVNILCIDEEKNEAIRENIEVCEDYLNNMIDHIHNIWTEMSKEFKSENIN